MTYFRTLIFIFAFATNICAGNTYSVTIENKSFSNPSTLEFDVNIRSTGSEFVLYAYQCSFSLTDNSGYNQELSFSYLPATSDLSNYPSAGIIFDSLDTGKKLSFASGAGTDAITASAKRIGRFRIESNKPFGDIVQINWSFSGFQNTILITNEFTDVTDASNHSDATINNILPVELTDFTAGCSTGNIVTLSWSTGTENENLGFEVHRRPADSSKSGTWEIIAFVRGNGTTNLPHNYQYTDKDIKSADKYEYRLKQIDFDGSGTFSEKIELVMDIPQTFSISQNYPNPFNGTTRIEYTLPETAEINISVFNTLGELVSVVTNGIETKGYHHISWQPGASPSGVYFYRISAAGKSTGSKFQKTRKLVYIR